MFSWIKILCAVIAFSTVTAGAAVTAYWSNHGNNSGGNGGTGGGGGGGGGGSAGAPGPIAGAGLPFLVIAGGYALVRWDRRRRKVT